MSLSCCWFLRFYVKRNVIQIGLLSICLFLALEGGEIENLLLAPVLRYMVMSDFYSIKVRAPP